MRASLSTVVGLITISGLAFTLIAIVIARSPYTHGNLSPEGYHRTKIAPVGEDLSKADAQEILEKVRQGPKTMPSFDASLLPDSDLQKLIAFLRSIEDSEGRTD